MPVRILRAAFNLNAPPQEFTYSEWADRNFYLPRESSAEYGKYRTSRTPFVKDILDELSPSSKTEVVVVVKPTQLAGTTIALIFLSGMVDMYPGPALMFFPTDAMARSFSKKKLTPAIKLQPSLRRKIRPPKSRDSANTILQKEYPGGSLMLTGSNSGASFRSESIKYLVIDDFDEFDPDIAGQGSPEELADRRTGSFPGRKIYLNSTTTEKDTSNIERSFAASSQGYFHVPCPHCGHYQYLVWGGLDAEHGIKFNRDAGGAVVEAWYVCESCHKRIDEHQKTAMIEAGKYVHKFPDRRVRGFRWNALYTPLGWVNSWAYIAQKFIDANNLLKRGDPTKLKTWLNTFMSEPYEERGDRPEWENLKGRCEPYQPLSVPVGAMILTSGTDVQHDRVAISVYGWGRGEECWLIYHIEIAGDPMHDEVWQQHDQIINRGFKHASGVDLHVVSAGIDAGDGATTQAVRNYCRTRAPKVFALKGMSTAHKPVIGTPTKQDLTWKGQKIENGVEMWPVGSDTAKATLYSRFNTDGYGPGYVHFYIGVEDEFFRQITAEKLVTRFIKGFPVKEWHNVRGNKRNEALDCWVYAYAAALRAGIAYIDFNKLALGGPGRAASKEAVKPKTINKVRRW